MLVRHPSQLVQFVRAADPPGHTEKSSGLSGIGTINVSTEFIGKKSQPCVGRDLLGRGVDEERLVVVRGLGALHVGPHERRPTNRAFNLTVGLDSMMQETDTLFAIPLMDG